MALSDAVLGLYLALRQGGRLDGIDSVVELGSQTVWCQDKLLLEQLFDAFGHGPKPDTPQFNAFISPGPPGTATSRALHKCLGFALYDCIDIDGKYDALPLDLNYDLVPEPYVCRYGLVTNNGTAEHVFNQRNVFEAMHDLAVVGGIIINVCPFIGWIDHGFYNYHPNFFRALAHANAYELVGIWDNHDPHRSLTAWTPDYSRLAGGNHLLVTVMRKTCPSRFHMPIQGIYAELPGAARYRKESGQ